MDTRIFWFEADGIMPGKSGEYLVAYQEIRDGELKNFVSTGFFSRADNEWSGSQKIMNFWAHLPDHPFSQKSSTETEDEVKRLLEIR